MFVFRSLGYIFYELMFSFMFLSVVVSELEAERKSEENSDFKV